jgi:hypothetical protein
LVQPHETAMMAVADWEVFSRGDDVAEQSVMEGKLPDPS